jgi:hypothetical protein
MCLRWHMAVVFLFLAVTLLSLLAWSPFGRGLVDFQAPSATAEDGISSWPRQLLSCCLATQRERVSFLTK